MYYGAADSCIGYATASLDDLLDYVTKYPCGESGHARPSLDSGR
jgi:hypothetical protein